MLGVHFAIHFTCIISILQRTYHTRSLRSVIFTAKLNKLHEAATVWPSRCSVVYLLLGPIFFKKLRNRNNQILPQRVDQLSVTCWRSCVVSRARTHVTRALQPRTSYRISHLPPIIHQHHLSPPRGLSSWRNPGGNRGSTARVAMCFRTSGWDNQFTGMIKLSN